MTFDDDTLLPNGGLTVAALLAQKLDITGLVDRHVTIDGQAGANGGAKAATVIASALAGGDCIDDVARLRAGASRRVFDDTRAPSTVGIWLRAFGWAAVRQLDRVTRELLARAWAAGLGPDLDAPQTIDIDSTVCETYGLAKQGGEFAYTGVRGYHPLIASLADTGELLHARLRGGNAGSGRGAASFVAETIRRVRDAGATGALTLRADSGFYAGAVVAACRRHKVAFSITARKNTAIQRAIDAIGDDALADAGEYAVGGAPAMAFQAELAFEAVDDGLDPLAHAAEVAEPGLFVAAVRTQQGRAHRGDDGFEVDAGEAFVGDQDLAWCQRLAVEHGRGDLAFGLVGRGQREVDRQSVGGGEQVQPETPEVAGMAGAVAIRGVPGEIGAFDGLTRRRARHRCRVEQADPVTDRRGRRDEFAQHLADGGASRRSRLL
jgi:hypothetical protein